MKITTLLFCLCIVGNTASTQTRIIDAHITSCQSQEKLIGVSIFADSLSYGTITNESGYFSLKIPMNLDSVKISYVGYEQKTIHVSDLIQNICLNENGHFDEIVIKSNRSHLGQRRNNVDVELIKSIPSGTSEIDIIKSLAILPGVSNGVEGTTDIYVRGGSVDQNLILLDGIPIFNVNHLVGYFSQFNAESIQSIAFYKGNSPAKYGGRLSSVIDITLNRGNQDSLRAQFGIGPLTSNIYLEGPLKGKTSFMFASRVSYLGLINLFTNKNNIGYYSDYWLYDINAKIHHDFKKAKLDFSFYNGNDYINSIYNGTQEEKDYVINSKSNSKINWGNNVISIKYTRPLGSNLSIKILGGYSRYYNIQCDKSSKTKIDSIETQTEHNQSQFGAFTNYSTCQVNTEYSGIQNNFLQFGIQASQNFMNINTTKNDTTNNNFSKFNEVGLYLNDKIRLNNFEINAGIRLSNYFAQDNLQTILEPRLEFRYFFKRIKLFAGYSKNSQFMQLISNNDLGLRTDYWVLASNKPSISRQVNLGSDFILGKFTFLLDLYYKEFDNIVDYFQILDNGREVSDWQENIHTNGIGDSKGIEFQAAYENETLKTSINYTLSSSDREFESINRGKRYPYTFAKTHDLGVSLVYKLSKKILFSSAWYFQTGTAVTLPIGRVVMPGGIYDRIIFGEYNNGRMPNYHRLDISMTYYHKTKKGRNIKWVFSIYNAYNRRNPNFLSIGSQPIFDMNGKYLTQEYHAELISQFAFLPSLSFSYEF